MQHTYPGIRSDSDLYTFGYRFRPWSGKPVAEGGAILEYLEGAIDDEWFYDPTVSSPKTAQSRQP